MKTFAVALVSTMSTMLPVVPCVAAEQTVKVTGIAQLSDRMVTLLEIEPERGPLLKVTLQQGDRVEGVEVISIDARAAKVSARVGGQIQELSLDTGDATGQTPVFRLKDAHFRQVLDLYQELSDRTVITAPSLLAKTITAKSDGALDAAIAAEALARILADKGITVTPQIEKFAFATTPQFVPKLATLRPPPEPAKLKTSAAAPPTSPEEVKLAPFPAGLIKFSEADLRQVLDIYQELAGRTLIVSPALPPARITLKSQTPLHRAEAIWLAEAALYLCDIAVTFSADKFAFVTATADVPRVAKIKEPPAPDQGLIAESFPPGLLKFTEADRAIVLDIYERVFGQTLLRAPDLPPLKITLKSQTPLTRDEAVWLLESALQLGGIRFVPAGDNQVKVIPETSLNAANN